MPEAGTTPARRRATRGITAALLTAALMPLNSTMVAVAVPAIGHQFDESPARVTQALVATYLIAAIALQSPGGKLGDRLGHWRVFAAGQVAIGAGALLGFLAPSLVLLTCCRVLMAAGGAVAVPATVALLRLELPPERRGRAFGTFGATMALATALGPVIGGVLVDAFGWPAVFLANVPVLVVSALLAATVQHGHVRPGTAAFDWPGSVLLTVALTLIVLAAQQGAGSPLALLAVGTLAFTAFVVRERRTDDPVIAFDLFRSAAFTAGTVLIAVQNLVMYALLFEVPLLLGRLFALDARRTGQTLIFLTAAMVLTSLAAGRLTDRFGARSLAVSGSLVCLGAAALLAGADMASPDALRWPLALLGVGLGLSGPAAQTASLSAVEGRHSGMGAGVSSTMRYLGGIVGVAVLGQILTLSGGRAVVLSSHRHVLGVYTAALVVGLGCALLLPGRTQPARLDQSVDTLEAHPS